MLELENIKDNQKSTLSVEFKRNVAEALDKYVSNYESQARAANSLKDVSAANITQILKGNWELITDKYWRNVAAQIGYKEFTWPVVQTGNLKELTDLFEEAQAYGENFIVIAPHGSGKTVSCEKYTQEHPEAFHLVCIDAWSIDDFLKDFAQLLGLKIDVYKRVATINQVTSALNKMNQPIVFFDEAHNLNGQIRLFFKSLVNRTEGKAALIMLGTAELREKLEADIKEAKHGGAEVKSRFGGNYFELQALTPNDVKLICQANDVQGAVVGDIQKRYNGDGRRVRRLILAEKREAARDKK